MSNNYINSIQTISNQSGSEQSLASAALQKPDVPEFPILEDILNTGNATSVIREIKSLCCLLDNCPVKHNDLETVNRIWSAREGLKETAKLFEKLQELDNKRKHIA